MTSKRSNLVANLRALDEHWGNVEPDPAFEKRLLARLQPRAAKRLPWVLTLDGFRKYARPLAFVVAICLVFILSVSDQAPPARSGLVIPHTPDAAIEPVETPPDEHLEPANPHRDDVPRTPSTSPAEPFAPDHFDTPRPWQPVNPRSPEHEWDSERSFFDQPYLGPRMSAPKSPQVSRQPSDMTGFWSPAQAISMDSPSRSTNPANVSSGGSVTRPKVPANASSSPLACFTMEALKNQAALDCEENGTKLADIQYLHPCKDGLFQFAEHECTEPPADDDMCTTSVVTDGDQCVDPGELKMLALTACKSLNKDLVDFNYTTGDCGWKARKGTYTCCPFVQEPWPPPSMVCQAETIGDGQTCKDPGLLKEEAHYLCTGLGQILVDLQPATNCANGQWSLAKVTCCTP